MDEILFRGIKRALIEFELKMSGCATAFYHLLPVKMNEVQGYYYFDIKLSSIVRGGVSIGIF